MAAVQEIGNATEQVSAAKVVRSGPRSHEGQISLGDEAALSWYFGQGLSIYDRSTFGAIIHKLAMDAYGSGPCERCEGSGILETGGFAVSDQCRSCKGEGKIGKPEKWCPSCSGFGKVAQYEIVVEHGGWCFSCRGSGSTKLDRKAKHRNRCRACGGKRKTTECRSCRECLGTGHEPLSARPQKVSSEACGVQPDDSALTRFAITSRRVANVRNQSPALAVALGVYYGDIGQRWALTDRGRLFSLFHLTAAGKKLARWGEKAGKSADLGLTLQERIGTQAALDIEQPKRERTALLDAATKQAKELYARAAEAWNDESSTRRHQRDLKRLASRLQGLGYSGLARQIHTHAEALT